MYIDLSRLIYIYFWFEKVYIIIVVEVTRWYIYIYLPLWIYSYVLTIGGDNMRMSRLAVDQFQECYSITFGFGNNPDVNLCSRLVQFHMKCCCIGFPICIYIYICFPILLAFCVDPIKIERTLYTILMGTDRTAIWFVCMCVCVYAEFICSP